MRAYTSIILLVTSAIGMCYLVLHGGYCLPILFARLYGIHSLAEVRDFMPALTRIAVDYSWVFAAFIGLTTIVSIALFDRYPARLFQFTLLGLCSQGILLWLTLFAYFYDGFEGPMSLHHGPEFDFGAFMGSGFGVFPVTLVGLVAAFITALFAGGRTMPPTRVEQSSVK